MIGQVVGESADSLPRFFRHIPAEGFLSFNKIGFEVVEHPLKLLIRIDRHRRTTFQRIRGGETHCRPISVFPFLNNSMNTSLSGHTRKKQLEETVRLRLFV